MFLRLNKKYALRGWIGANRAIVYMEQGQAEFIDATKFNILLLCDGSTELEGDVFSEEELNLVQKFLKKGIIEKTEEPNPIDPKQEYHRYNNRFVRSILWSVTGRCNFKCRHCYMDAPNGLLGEISHEEAISIIDQMAACGILDVSLTGGEVFVRKDIWELIEHINNYGIRISQIYTNGWLVNEEVLDKLEAMGQKPEFNFSFDCLEWHDWMRRVKGSEKRVIDAIKLCQKRGFPTGIEACVHRGSISTLRETIKLMGSLNTRVKVGSLMDTELWQKNGEGYGLSTQEYFDEMIKYIDCFFEDGMPANVTLGAVIRLNKNSNEYRIIGEKLDGSEKCRERHLCGAARMCSYITPEGRLLPCMPMTAWEGHTQFKKIQEIGLEKGLTDGFYMQFVDARIKDLLEKNKKCNACEYKLRCGGGCRASGLTDEGNLYGSEHLQCIYWKNGYLDKIRNAVQLAIEKHCK